MPVEAFANLDESDAADETAEVKVNGEKAFPKMRYGNEWLYRRWWSQAARLW